MYIRVFWSALRAVQVSGLERALAEKDAKIAMLAEEMSGHLDDNGSSHDGEPTEVRRETDGAFVLSSNEG